MINKILTILLFTFYITTFGQNNFKNIVLKYNDSIRSKDYGLVGLYKKNNNIKKVAIGYAFPNEIMTTDKVFNIGSLTKTFTSVLILQDVEKGNIKLTDSLVKYFPPEFCENKHVDLNITIEQLLSHKSGLGEIAIDTILNKAFLNPYFEYNHTFLFNKIPKPISKPNITYKYCNTNYILLGYILEIVNNKPYSDIIRERIFEPCNMKNSYTYYSKNIKNAAHPMLYKNDLSDVIPYKFYQNLAFSAGSISSNLDDLSSFFYNLYNYKLLSKESFKKMIGEETEKYGLGIEKYKFNNEVYYGHGGDNISFRVKNYYNPKTKELTILMANHYNDPYTLKIVEEFLKK